MNMDTLLLKAHNTKKSFRIIMVIGAVFLASILIYSRLFANDACWLIATGKYIFNNGFPKFEPLTYHVGLEFTSQQWLSAVIFYLIYNKLGIIYLDIFIGIIGGVIVFLFYYLCMIVSRNNTIVSLLATGLAWICIDLFLMPRPQVFSYSIFILELIILEKYTINNNKKILFYLPLLSMLLINFHAAMWPVFFILLVPYIIDGTGLSFLLVIKAQKYPIKWLIILSGISVVCGLVNPYGVKNMYYTLISYNNEIIKFSITEMSSPDFKTTFGYLFFIIIMTVVLGYIFYKDGKTTLRYALLSIGTLFMALSSNRSIMLFIITAIPFLTYYLNDCRLKFNYYVKNTMIGDDVFKVLIVLIVCVVLMISGIYNAFNKDQVITNRDDIVLKAPTEFLLRNLKVTDRLYNEFETGGYLEMMGIKTFIDSRAEVFIKAMNKKEDILKDYTYSITGKLNYKDFVNKYNFNYLLVSNEKLMDVYLSKDKMYSVVYKDSNYKIFKKGKL